MEAWPRCKSFLANLKHGGFSYSDTMFAHFTVGQSLESSHLRGEHCCRSSAARSYLLPGRHHSRSWNYRNVRNDSTKPKEQLVPKQHLCRAKWSLHCASVQQFSLRLLSWRAFRVKENLLKVKSKPTTNIEQELTQNGGVAGVGRPIQPFDEESFP